MSLSGEKGESPKVVNGRKVHQQLLIVGGIDISTAAQSY
jgi:hypothetical protein